MDDQGDIEEIGLHTQLMIRQKALRRRPTRTSKTSNYVRCWLDHCIYGIERTMKDKHELITLNEKDPVLSEP